MKTELYLLNQYGPMISQEIVAEIFGYESLGSLSNAISSGKIDLRKNGINRYHYRDVAAAVDALAVSPPDQRAEAEYIVLGSPNRRDQLPPQLPGSTIRARKGAKSPRASGREDADPISLNAGKRGKKPASQNPA